MSEIQQFMALGIFLIGLLACLQIYLHGEIRREYRDLLRDVRDWRREVREARWELRRRRPM